MSPSHRILSLLVLNSALVARALPLLNTQGDLQVFANAFVSTRSPDMISLDACPQLGTATGGAFTSCDTIGADLDVLLETGFSVRFDDWLA